MREQMKNESKMDEIDEIWAKIAVGTLIYH